MIYRGKNVIAAKRNSSGILVYIPEIIRVNGRKYIQPYRFSNHALSANLPRIVYSVDEIVDLRLFWDSRNVSITFPFSYQMLLDLLSGQLQVDP